MINSIYIFVGSNSVALSRSVTFYKRQIFVSKLLVLAFSYLLVDAHVSSILVEGLLNGPLKDKTRILVTHHLEVLPKASLIIMVSVFS